jgi:hypothetical protein
MTPNTYSIVNELLRGSVTKEQAIAWIEEGRQHAFKNGRAAERIENGEYAVTVIEEYTPLVDALRAALHSENSQVSGNLGTVCGSTLPIGKDFHSCPVCNGTGRTCPAQGIRSEGPEA